MEIAMKDGLIYMRNMDSQQYEQVKSIGKVKWDKQKQMLIGPVDFDILQGLSKMIKLPPRIEQERARMAAVQDQINELRMKETVEPLVHYPVKANLFMHQIKAANMALLAFGAVKAGGETDANS